MQICKLSKPLWKIFSVSFVGQSCVYMSAAYFVFLLEEYIEPFSCFGFQAVCLS